MESAMSTRKRSQRTVHLISISIFSVVGICDGILTGVLSSASPPASYGGGGVAGSSPSAETTDVGLEDLALPGLESGLPSVLVFISASWSAMGFLTLALAIR